MSAIHDMEAQPYLHTPLDCKEMLAAGCGHEDGQEVLTTFGDI